MTIQLIRIKHYYRLNRDPFLTNAVYNSARAVVDSGPNVADREIEFVNLNGQNVAHGMVIFDIPPNAFAEGLGADLVVNVIIKIEIINTLAPNTVIMILAVDLPAIY